LACYQAETTGHPELAGTVTVKFHVNATGSVTLGQLKAKGRPRSGDDRTGPGRCDRSSLHVWQRTRANPIAWFALAISPRAPPRGRSRQAPAFGRYPVPEHRRRQVATAGWFVAC